MLSLGWPTKRAYLQRLFSSHDFAVEAEILDLDERPLGDAVLLDGEVQIIEDSGDGVRRTASVTLSDPAGALDFSTSAAWSGTSLWANRLLRLTHVLEVGGEDVRCVFFLGVPTSLSRDGAEVDVSLSDKAALANRGAPPLTVAAGKNAVEAIRQIMAERTGEFRFRFPTSTRRLSQDYAVGLEDEVSPMAVAREIARRELGMQLLYAADGALLLRPMPAAPSLTVPGVTAPLQSSVDFSAMRNWVQVTGKTADMVNKYGTTVRTMPRAVAQVDGDVLGSPESLKRRGVLRYLPLVIADDALTTVTQVKDRAEAELRAADRAESAQQFQIIPFFHGDADDLVRIGTDGANPTVRMNRATIPAGVGGDMTLGRNMRARRAPRVASSVRLWKWKKVVTGKGKSRSATWQAVS